jgi:outer membrane protein assembly factor BamA
LLFVSVSLYAQTDTTYTIAKIKISGNYKTAIQIIEREIDVYVGESISHPELISKLNSIQNRIFNTGLFVLVKYDIDSLPNQHITIHILVKERWYTYIIPLLELADRNYNEWWQQRDRDLNRINYGFWLVQKNMRGRNETLKIKLQGGFTGKLEGSYTFPYIHKKQTAGLSLGISYIYSRAVAASLLDHKLYYLENNKAIIKRFAAGAEYQYRGKYYTLHRGKLQFQHQSVLDTVTRFNPLYFGNGKNERNYISLSYGFSIDRRDIQYYALKGYVISLELEKNGFVAKEHINTAVLKSEASLFTPLVGKFYYASGISSKLLLPKKQAFYDSRALGYDNHFVRGYELYVINGQFSAVWKNSIKFQLYHKTKEANWLPWGQFTKIPLSIYPSINFDMGYVHDTNPENGNARISNTLLQGGGLGIDFVTYYDLVFRSEYSFNRLGQHGFYLHFMAAIGGKKFL